MKYPASTGAPHRRRAYGINEAADLYSVSRQFLRKQIRLGHLHARKVSRRVLIMDEDLTKFFERQRQAGAAA